MNILLLDDEPLELEQLEYLLRLHYPAWKIVKAQNGSRAFSKADELLRNDETFQLAFIDINLPGKSGLVVASELAEQMPEMKMVIVSAYQDFNYAKDSIQLGVIDYLVKPVIERELLLVLEKITQDDLDIHRYSDLVQKVIKKVKQDYREPLKLSDIAVELHINPSYLSRRFGEELGVSFSDFLLNYRIKIAEMLLVKNRHWSIQQVADETGFNSQHYFSTAFKKVVNKSPKDYRNDAG
ncbi:MAG: DNA-binding response regulator [Bacillota bacterium]|nr:DNA-binding response regulator [Bacillota bacterium]MDW7682687.1 DNA-binding response regulator [Bacillota bacterium]